MKSLANIKYKVVDIDKDPDRLKRRLAKECKISERKIKVFQVYKPHKTWLLDFIDLPMKVNEEQKVLVFIIPDWIPKLKVDLFMQNENQFEGVFRRMAKKYEKATFGLEAIEKAICLYFNLTSEELRERNRQRETRIIPRHFAMYFAKKYNPTLSLEMIGLYFSLPGKRPYDHATVLHAKRNIADWILTDENMEIAHSDLIYLINNLKNGLNKKDDEVQESDDPDRMDGLRGSDDPQEESVQGGDPERTIYLPDNEESPQFRKFFDRAQGFA